jgi:integrase
LRDYVGYRRQSWQISTVNREIGFLKAFFSKAVEWGYLGKNPAAKLKAFKESKRKIPRFFSEREVDLLLDKGQKLSSYLYLLIFTAVSTGLRKSELIHLSWQDVNFDSNTVIVQAKEDWHPKDYEIRSIPIGEELAVELKKHKLGQEGISRWVFPAIYGTVRKNNLGRDFRLLLEKWGFYRRGVGWHTLRHTFASHLVMQGIPLKVVAELLGHQAPRMTEIYLHLSPDHLRDSVQKLPFGKNRQSRKRSTKSGRRSKGLKVVKES